ncbi:MAG TPA: ABC transporter permease [Puia sp.]|nr:ABC transporter permease [Puia sp.]
MFKNYFKTAIRNLWKNRFYTSINIIGLAVGLATCLLILFFVADELGYDRYNSQADRIYRVDGDIQFGGNHFVLAVCQEPLGPTLKKDIPAVKQYCRFRNYGGFLVRKGAQNVAEDKVIYADSTLFDVFTFPVIGGNPHTALVEPKTVVITEQIARKYFNSTDVVGKTLQINDTGNLKITAVIKNIPKQSHFNFDFFVSSNGAIQPWEINNWVSNNLNTYIVLNPGADPKKTEGELNDLVIRYMAPQVKAILNADMNDKEAFRKTGNYVNYTLTPLTSIHLHSNKVAELGSNSSIEYVYIFSIVAVLVLLIACVNFMNLSTARSASRSKEVGIRKVLGSIRSKLIAQFLTESIVISLISLLLAVIIAWMLLPYFNQMSGKQMSMLELFTKPWLLPSLIALVFIVGILAGSYPAFFLSAFMPVEVLRGNIAKGFKSGWLRSSLVVFQFFISIILIVSTVVIYNQLSYIRNKDIGFNREQVLVIKNTNALNRQAKTFKEEVLKLSAVKSGTMTGYLPTSDWRSDSPIWPDPSLDAKKAVSTQMWQVDEDYIPTLGMTVASGRNFSRQMLSDSSGVIVNEAAAKLLGFKNPVNQKVYALQDIRSNKSVSYTILGVVKNFNFNSLREEVTPLVLFLNEQNGNMAFRIDTRNIPGLISQIEAKWRTMAPSQPFSYSFMDDDFNNIYQTEQRIGKIFISFAIFAILIACLGLFGLVTYAAEQRTKEIGIRKVLGASVITLASTLSKDFLRLVLVSAIVAFPVSWWAMNKWLQNFAYRIHISWWIFVVAGFLAVFIAIATVSFQAIKAALANPAKSLRSE